MRSENTWPEIRDHSFIQNHSRSSDSQLLLFSSPHSSSTGFRSENIWPEIRDHSFIQNHSRSFTFTASSLQFTSLIFYRVQIREHLTRDQRPFLHPESLQIFRFTSSPLQFTSLVFYRVQIREHLTRDQRPFLHPESLQIFRFTASSLQFTSLIFYRVQVREHLTRDQRPFLHPESLQIFRFTASSLQFTHSSSTGFRSETIPSSRITPDPSDSQLLLFSSLTHLLQGSGQRTPDRHQRPFLHPESLQIFRFTASSLQFTSLMFYRVQIRDHSFIQNHSRSSDSQLLLFSSPHSSSTGFRSENTWQTSETIPSSRITPDLQIHSFSSSVHLTHLLQGSGQRTPDTRSETIPSSRITPDLQIHSFFSSVHLTHLLQGSDQRTSDPRSETIPSSRITPDPSDSQHLLFSSPHSSSTGFRLDNTWHEIRDHSFIQNHSRSSDSQLLLFSWPHSSSTGFRSENTWPEIRDHSFIQNLSRSSDSQLLLFSSPHSSSTGFRLENTWQTSETIPSSRITPDLQIHSFSSSVHLTHALQGSGQRTPDTRSETIPSSRITPDLQIHSFFSSVHSLIFYRVQVREHLTRDQRPFLHPESLQIFRFTASPLQFTSLIFYRVQIREHLTRDQRPFLHPESLQIFRFTASPLQFTSLIFYRVQVREHLTRDQRPFLHPESLQIFRFTSSPLQFTSLVFYRVQVRGLDWT